MSEKTSREQPRRVAETTVEIRGPEDWDRLRKMSRVDWERLRNMTEEEIERTSPPELKNLPDDFWDDAVVVYPESKTPISLRVDADVLQWFRDQGPKYQSRISAVLRSYMEGVARKQPRKRARSKKKS